MATAFASMCLLASPTSNAGEVGHDKSGVLGPTGNALIRPADLVSRASISTAFKFRLLPHNSTWAATRARTHLRAEQGEIEAAFERIVDRTASHFGDDGKPVDGAVVALTRQAIGGHSGYVVGRLAAELGIAHPSSAAIRRLSAHLKQVAKRGQAPTEIELASLAEALAADLAPHDAAQQHRVRSKLRNEGWMLGEYGWSGFDNAMSASFGDALQAVTETLRLDAGRMAELTTWIAETPLSGIQRAILSPGSPVEELAAVVAAGAHLGYAQTKGHQAQMEISSGKSGKPGKAEARMKAPEIAPYAEVLAISGDPNDSRIISDVAALDLFGVLGAANASHGATPPARQAERPHAAPGSLRDRLAESRVQVAASDRIGASNVEVSIVGGDITQMPVDAVVVPHFLRGASWGGVGAAVARAGAGDAIESYEGLLGQHSNRNEWGEAHLTRSTRAPWSVINVKSVGSDRSQEFEVVGRSVYAALAEARRSGASSIALPLLGTGIIGNLTAGQSARAMLGAIARFEQDATPGAALPHVAIVVFRDPQATREAADVLRKQDYGKGESHEVGAREFDFARWHREMQRDWADGPGNPDLRRAL